MNPLPRQDYIELWEWESCDRPIVINYWILGRCCLEAGHDGQCSLFFESEHEQD